MRRVVLLLLFWSACLLGHAQQRFLRQLGAAEGLPQPFIYALHQDAAGYLWIGTAEGLVRYDGTTFTRFTSREGLAEDFVTGLTSNKTTGQLRVRHYQGGISRQVSDNRFQPVRSAGHPGNLSLPAPDSARIGAVLRRYRPQLPAGTVVACVLRDREGTYWLGTAGQGLWRLANAHLSFYPTAFQPRSLAPVAEGTVVGTAAGTLVRVQLTSTGQLRQRELPGRLPSAITALDSAAGYWLLGTEESGLWYVPSLMNTPQRVPGLPATLRVSSVAAAAAGSWWVGTLGEGAYQLPAALQPATSYTTANGLLHNTIYTLLPDQLGRVWFGTHNTGLGALLRENGQGQHLRAFRLTEGGLDVAALLEWPRGQVWIGTEGQGLFRYSRGRFRHFTARSHTLPDDYCYGLLPWGGGVLITHRQGLSWLQDTVSTSLASSAPPFVRELLPNAASLLPDGSALLATRDGLLRVERPTAPVQVPAAAFTEILVDGQPHSPSQLVSLPARQYRVAVHFRSVSLLPAEAWQFQYRLLGHAPEWSRPSRVRESQFARLDYGTYVLEVRTRRGDAGPWSAPARLRFHIATPVWRTGWFAALAVVVVAAGAYGLVRAREATLRRRQRELEQTVQQRTIELVEARDAAEASRVAKSRFLANMSHEIRTPMNAVMGLSHLLRQSPLSREQLEYLTAIQGASNNLLTILNDILDSSKIDAGKLELEATPFHLPIVLRRVAAMFQFATASKELYFRLELAPELPPAVLGDPVRLQQILVNLVGNAVKFTHAGGITLQASATPPENGWQRVRLAVQDTGIGIPADKLDTIFEDFSQANTSTTREFGGTGLGLSIARNLVHLHQGRLWVESQEGRGSTFFVELEYPLAEGAELPAEAPSELHPFEPPLRVLVAEDNDLNQLVARRTLEAWNVQVTLAANGRLAVEAALRQPFDAVLMDVNMPEMDGYQATRELRRHFPDARQLPIIGLTASVLPEDRALALAAGMNETLPKPFEPAVLYAELAHRTGRATVAPPPERPSVASVLPELRPDWSLLEELAGSNATFMVRVLETFLREAPRQITALQAAQQLPDLPQLAREAHKLKGQLAYFGLRSLTQNLEQLEILAKANNPDALPMVALIEQQFRQVFPLIQLRHDELAASL